MSLRRKILLVVAAVLAVAVGAYLLREPVRNYLIQPVFTAFWYLNQIYGMLPQKFVWTLLMLLGAAFGIHSLFQSRERPRYAPLPPPYYTSRVETWEKWLQDADHGELYKLKITTEMGDLLLRTVAERSQISYGEARKQLQSGFIPAPAQAVELVNNTPLTDDLSPLLRAWKRFRRGKNQNEIYRQMEALVGYLETELEV
ncbi:MAG: hypothetical protein OEV06_06515 [Anaerolineae bacterium]|nr:hypothetical protein [Anaerolineae bacterium]